MDMSPEIDADENSEVLDEPYPAPGAIDVPNGDPEVSSRPPEYITSRRVKEAHVRRRVNKDGKDGKDAKARGGGKGERAMEGLQSTMLVSVAVVVLVGAIIAKIALARKISGS